MIKEGDLLPNITLRSVAEDGTQNFNLYDFTIPALKRLSELGNKFCIITNQSGISRGLIKEENLNSIHDFIYGIFKQHEIKLLKIFPFEINEFSFFNSS